MPFKIKFFSKSEKLVHFQQSQFPLQPLALLLLAQKQELRQRQHRGYFEKPFDFLEGSVLAVVDKHCLYISTAVQKYP